MFLFLVGTSWDLWIPHSHYAVRGCWCAALGPGVLHVVTASLELRRDPWIWKKRLKRWWGWKWAISVCTQVIPCGCFQKKGYPQIMNFNRFFHYKPSILGYPYFWKHPCINIVLALKLETNDMKGQVHGLKGSQLLKKQQQRVLAAVLQQWNKLFSWQGNQPP